MNFHGIIFIFVPILLLPLIRGMEDTPHSENHISHCSPLNTTCFCTPNDEFYELQCPNIDDASVLIKFAPNEYLDIDCLDNPSQNLVSLSDFSAKGIKKLAFRNCTLPPEGLNTLADKFQFDHLVQLKIVITNFENISLTSEFLGVLRKSLRFLTMEGNGLEEVPLGMFEGMENLQMLDLNSNELTGLPSRYFRHVPNLVDLDLSRNLLERISGDAFEGLTQLKRLDLWSNRLKNLPSTMFFGLRALESLELGVNRNLDYLPNGIFHQLENLEQINLRLNNVTDLPSNLFEMNVKLKTIRLDSNPNLKHLPNSLFYNLSALKEIQAYDCGFTELHGELFRGCTNLTILILRNNYLTRLPDDLFLGLEHLEHLQLKNNKIESISTKLLESLYSLKVLDLTGNSLTKIQLVGFKQLASLEELILQENKISEIEGFTFKGLNNLKILDLSYNNLTLVQEISTSNFFNANYAMLFQALLNLEELDLSFNRITTLEDQWLMNKSKLKKISLQNNQIKILEYQSLQTISNEKELYVHLDNNMITTVDFTGASVIAKSNPNGTIFIVQLGGNPWRCDCHLYDLLRYYRLELEPEVRAQVDLRATDFQQPMICQSPTAYKDQPVMDLPLTALSCPLVTPNDINICPDHCTCHYRPQGNAVIVDCVKCNLTTLPSLLMSSSTNNSTVNEPQQQQSALRVTFSGVHWNGDSAMGGSLEVWAQGNGIEIVREVGGYGHVAVLDVSGNKIRDVEWVPNNLKDLKLHNNNLQGLSDDILTDVSNITNITLDNNPWKCNCQTLTLSNFLRDHFIDKDIRCDRDGLYVRKLTESELCPSNALTILTVSLLVLIPLLLCTLLAAFYYRYQRPVKVWLYAHPLTQWLVTHEDLDRDLLYDAFVCYAHDDEAYVEKMLTELEGGEQPYKVCIHRRDWVPGVMIADQIDESVRQSRRTIVVLSPAFVRSQWARMEFRTAHASDLKEGRARLIVILLGHLDPKVLEEDEELRAYCSTKTYLKHDDANFWQKLRYAMPHRGFRKPRPIPSAGNGKVSRLNQIMVNIDRQDLIATPTTPNPGTTPPAHALGTEESLLRRLDPMEFLVKGGKFGGLDDSHLQSAVTA